MNVILNGKPHTTADGTTVAEMLRGLKIEPLRVAVEINEDIVSRKAFSDTTIQDGDRIEIVTFVGGGAW